MKKNDVKRWTALVLTLVMALSLAVPTLGATPMLSAAVEETPVAEVGHTHAVAETPAGNDAGQAELAAACCSATTPHEAGATILCSSAATEHYCVASDTNNYVNVTLKLEGDYASLKVSSKSSSLSNNGVNPPTLGYKHKVGAGDTAIVTLSNGSVITLRMVDPNACAHTYDDGEVTKEATCTADGVRTYTCSKCGGTKTEKIPALEHQWNDGQETTAPTCYQKGVKTYTCSVGGETRTEDIPATGNHTYGNDGKCTTPGCTSVDPDKCTHSMATVTPKAATCTENGVQGGQYCTICGQGEAAAKTVLKASGHNWGSDGKCTNPGCGEEKNTSFLSAAGDLESAYALWPIDSAVSKYEAYIIDSGNKETKVDDRLIRQYPGYMRVDVLGLKAGSYKIKVKDNKGGEMTTGTLSVKAHDRTGYGFVGGTANGAYNADGTLKENAKVIYVTNATFETVQLTVKNAKGTDVTFTGVQAIVDTSGVSKTAPGTPVCIRVLGTIDTTGFPEASWKSDKEGLQVKGDKANTDKNLTIEGVGNDAVFNGFGMLIRNCKNVEVRNIGLFNFADDGISVDTDNSNLWVHNNDFFYGGVGSDSDQVKGDGSLDTKQSSNITYSYNHFWDSGKCNLQGMDSETTSNCITYHHNWFDHSDSRHPRIRTCTVHIYNNYYDGNVEYGVAACKGASVFVEANYFRNTKMPTIIGQQGHDLKDDGKSYILTGDGGAIIKFYSNIIVGAKKFTSYQEDPVEFDAYVASSRDEKISSSVKPKDGSMTYTNFDTASDFYTYQVDTATDARLNVTQWAGRVQGGDFQYEFDDNTQDTNKGVIPELKAAVVGYKGKLVKVGGEVDTSETDEHKCVAGAYRITKAATCTEAGEETCYCVECDEVMSTRSLAPAHANDGSGECQLCAEKTENASGPVLSGNGKVLKYSDFSKPAADKTAITSADMEKVADGYFKVVGSVNKRTKSDSDMNMKSLQLGKNGGGGFEFTVGGAPATIKVQFSGVDSAKASYIVLKQGDTVIKTTDGVSYPKSSKSSDMQEVTYTVEEKGSYQLTSYQGDTNNMDVRVYLLSVTETEAACEHEATTHHDAVAATCTKDGNIEYWTCNSCNKDFADEACTKLMDDVTIEATGKHTWGEWSESDANGVQTRQCEDCNTKETRLGGNLGEAGDEVTWVLDDAGKLTITNTDNHIGTGEMVLVALWGDDDNFQGVKIMDASKLTATVGDSWDHLKLIWVNDLYAPQCQAKSVSAID